MRIGAFTVIEPYAPPEFPGYNPINEPVYQVANFMVPLAHAYLILKAGYPEDTALLASVRRWGNRLFRLTSNANDEFTGPHRGIDRRAHIAQGWASWGNVAENRTALDRCQRRREYAPARRRKNVPRASASACPRSPWEGPARGTTRPPRGCGGPRVGGACGPTGSSGGARLF